MPSYVEHTKQEIFMKLAYQEALTAYHLNEVPVGAIAVNESGQVIGQAYNLKESNYDCCGHSEIILLRQLSMKLQNWRLSGVQLYVTLEPCLMCLSAMVHARIASCSFAAYDHKAGAISLGYRLHEDPRLNHNFQVIGGIMQRECSNLLQDFFRQKRQK